MDELIHRNIFISFIINIIITLLLCGLLGRAYINDQQRKIKTHIDNSNKELIEAIQEADSLNKEAYIYIVNKFETWGETQKKP
jgi:hypothetical protein